MPSSNAFGQYLRTQRKAARFLQADLAKALGVTPGYISQVERGERAPIGPEHWGAIVKLLPGTTIADLQRAAAMTRPLEIDLSKAKPQQAELALALALRLRDRNLGDDETAQLLAIVQSGGTTPVRAHGRVLDRGGAPVSGRAYIYRLSAARGWCGLVGVRAHDGHAAGPMDGRTVTLVGKPIDLSGPKDPRGPGSFNVPGGLPPGEYALDVHRVTKEGVNAEDWAWPLVVTDGQAPQDVRIVCGTSTPRS